MVSLKVLVDAALVMRQIGKALGGNPRPFLFKQGDNRKPDMGQSLGVEIGPVGFVVVIDGKAQSFREAAQTVVRSLRK